jgi:hypothetical protein
LEVEPAEGRRQIEIRGFIGTERLLSFLQKDSRVLADIPNRQSILLPQHRLALVAPAGRQIIVKHNRPNAGANYSRIFSWGSETSA